MYELITGPMEYLESVIILSRVLEFIKIYGETTNVCGFHVNMSLNGHPSLNIRNINKIKMCLDIDENTIFEHFPTRKNNVYTSSVKNIQIKSPYLTYSSIGNISLDGFQYPNNKYYGINFAKLDKNYLEFRYLGGIDYETKYKETVEIIKQLGSMIYNNILYPQLSQENKEKLSDLLEENTKVFNSLTDFNRLTETYPDFNLTVDMNNDPQIIQAYHTQILFFVWNLIVNCGVTSGNINYDTDVSVWQISEATIKHAINLDGVELIDCKFQGYGKNLTFWSSELHESILYDCNFVNGNEVKNSKIYDCKFRHNNTFDECYVMNIKKYEIDGEFTNSILRKGMLSDKIETDNLTVIVKENY